MQESKFTGGLLGLIGVNILQWLVTTFTFGRSEERRVGKEC